MYKSPIDREFDISRHAYWITPVGEAPADVETSGSGTGIIACDGSTAIISCGTPAGMLLLRMRQLLSFPEETEPTETWDEIAELTLENSVPATDFQVLNLDGGVGATFARVESEFVGVRIHARGRDQASEIFPYIDSPVEAHLIQMWPADSPIDARIIATRDKFGAHFGRL